MIRATRTVKTDIDHKNLKRMVKITFRSGEHTKLFGEYSLVSVQCVDTQQMFVQAAKQWSEGDEEVEVIAHVNELNPRSVLYDLR